MPTMDSRIRSTTDDGLRKHPRMGGPDDAVVVPRVHDAATATARRDVEGIGAVPSLFRRIRLAMTLHRPRQSRARPRVTDADVRPAGRRERPAGGCPLRGRAGRLRRAGRGDDARSGWSADPRLIDRCGLTRHAVAGRSVTCAKHGSRPSAKQPRTTSVGSDHEAPCPTELRCTRTRGSLTCRHLALRSPRPVTYAAAHEAKWTAGPPPGSSRRRRSCC